MNVLILGLGGVGQRHLRLLKKLFPLVNVFAVRKKNRHSEINDQLELDTSINIEEKYNITICKTIKDAAKFKIDFAIVSNPTSLHVETSLKLLEFQIPVLLEKPLSNNSNGIEELCKISKKTNTQFTVAFMMRYHPCSIKLRELISMNGVGKIYNVIVNVNSFFPSWHNYEKYNEFYAGKKELGGGVILTEIHEIDLLSLLFGSPECLFAVGGKRSSFDIDVEDNVSVLMKYQFNNYEFSASLNMSFVQKSPLRNITILGEHGNIFWDMTKNNISIENFTNDYSENFSYKNFQRNNMFEDQLLEFVKIFDQKEKIDKSLEDSIGAHKIVMAIKQSISEGEVINL
jgi:predicted dehydrogenase